MTSKLYEDGLAMRRRVLGDAYVDRALAGGADALGRPLQELVTEYCWGAIWNRPGLEPKMRSLLNLGMLIALDRPQELKVHVRGALRNGWTREEVVEVVLQAAVYCGLPAAIDANRTVRATFAEMDEEEGAG